MSSKLLELALAKPGGQDGVSAFMSGVSFARDNLPEAGDDEAEGTFLQDLSQALEAMAAIRQDAPKGAAPNPFGIKAPAPEGEREDEEEETEDEQS